MDDLGEARSLRQLLKDKKLPKEVFETLSKAPFNLQTIPDFANLCDDIKEVRSTIADGAVAIEITRL